MLHGGHGRCRGGDQRGMIAAVALAFLAAIAVLGLTLLTASQVDRFASARTRSRAEAFYVAEGGLHAVVNSLKTNASNVVRATYPVMPGLLTNSADWGFTAANFPGGIAFHNMAGGQFQPNDPSSNVVVTIRGIGRGHAQVTVWLKSVGATVADPVVFGATSGGTIPNGTSRTVLADVTLVARGGRPPNPIQTGGLEGPVLNLLTDGMATVSGTVLDGRAAVRILKRVGNTWSLVGTATAANAPAGGPYPFILNLGTPLVRGETYSATSLATGGSSWSPLAFPGAVE